tara:strand:+ start:365 stop:550 length:186 start_codon:yes stop_codon:yes gene_type:complete
MKLNNIELNVLLVALDHMQEHLDEVGKDVDMSDKIQALKSLKIKIIEATPIINQNIKNYEI